MKCLVSFVLAVLALSSVIGASGASVGVWNTPPMFITFDERGFEDSIEMVANVSDYNGWGDIFRITVIASDTSGGIVSEVVYQQYPTNTSEVRIDRFEDVTGGYLIPEDQVYPYEGSRVDRFSASYGWFLENTSMQVTFLYTPFEAARLEISMEDMAGSKSVLNIPFTQESSVHEQEDGIQGLENSIQEMEKTNTYLWTALSFAVGAAACLGIVLYLGSRNKMKPPVM